MYRATVLLLLLAATIQHASCALDLAFDNDDDLTHFVSRPDIKAPLLDLVVHAESNTDPGYLFVAPMASVYQEVHPSRYTEPWQTGPHIYDSHGDLIWSGARRFHNKNFADFRPIKDSKGNFRLSGIEIGLNASRDTHFGDGETKGQGHVLSDSYEPETVIAAPSNIDTFNMHELRVQDDVSSALHLLWRPEYLDVTELDVEGQRAGWVGNGGFREVDVATGETTFMWWALDHVPLAESTWPFDGLEGPSPNAWDYFHATSVDKNGAGEYLLSSRHTNRVYKIASDGSIVWRLGGKKSSFTGDVDFSRQHDARFINAQDVGEVSRSHVEYITLFDNAADELSEEPSTSSAHIIRLDTQAMTAQTLLRIPRPDAQATLIGGNAHVASNGNIFVNWGANSYISEHSPQGKLLLEASFASDRFSNYRTYKAEWKARPSEDELAIKCFVHGTSADKATTVCYTSWNGATEVRSWRFFEYGDDGSSAFVVQAPRTGFETIAQWQGASKVVHVEALDGHENVLGKSPSVEVVLPRHWTSSASI